MAIFRADHYLIAEFDKIQDPKAEGEKILDALKELGPLKDLAIVTKRMEGKQWAEIVGRIDIPEGSKAFWAMVKKDITEREPYNLFIRIDVNAEAEDIDEAREKVKRWIESEWVPKIEDNISVKTIKVMKPEEVYMPKLEQ
ncbi:hypothetical protein EU538_03525 [Candidatus Thorarchaeota archaeon]|nr:MAG: hypothetical protein EU538_03525 [Candidatus Thorarchaeota archaeon]